MNPFEKDTSIRIENALKTASTTKNIVIGYGAIASLPKIYNTLFAGIPAILVADSNTWKAAGMEVKKVLNQTDIIIEDILIIEDSELYAETKYVDIVTEFVEKYKGIPVSIGSGTLNDLTKLAAYKNNRQYISVATAASVDGYTAFGASITDKGFKQTLFCPAPVAVIADLSVIENAPEEMNVWGYTDLLAKVPAGADWIIADALDIEKIDDVAWELVQKPLRKLVADPAGIRSKNPQALCYLMEGLIMSGLAMQRTNSSRPASGAEHQFSHLWDNQHHLHNGEKVSHGFKVAVGSMASLALYEMILNLSKDDIQEKIETAIDTWPEFTAIEKTISEHFTDSEECRQIIEQSKAKYVNKEELINRHKKILSHWDELKLKLKEQVIGFADFRDMLKLAKAPVQPMDIGIGIDRLKQSFYLAQLIRQRYTIFDFAKNIFMFDDAVDKIFSKNMFSDNE